MDRPAYTVYLFYGDDEFAIAEVINQLRERLGDPTTADMNTQRFSAVGLNLGALEEACAAMPFLAHRRLVVVDNVERLSQDKSWDGKRKERFFSLLNDLPESTAVVLIEYAELQSSKKEDNFKKRSPFYQWAESNPNKAYIRKCSSPKSSAFLHWLMKRCKSLGGEIEPTAAHLLAELVAEDLYLANQELTKLLDYVDRKRPIETNDVELLTPFHGQSDVFAMVDALGQRRGQEALQLLRRLLEDKDPKYAFAMIVRQFRLLLQAREALDLGLNTQQVLRVHPFVVDKVSAQARNFSLADLERIYHKLLTIDLATKTGQAYVEVELDNLIATLSN